MAALFSARYRDFIIIPLPFYWITIALKLVMKKNFNSSIFLYNLPAWNSFGAFWFFALA